MTLYRQSQADTIVARATAPGEAALAVVRVSGPAAFEVAARVLEPMGESDEEKFEAKPWRARLCVARHPDSGAALDEVVAIAYAAPRSYTGEDMIEIVCHGGVVTTQAVVEACVRAGGRAAEPGEFTQRAFLNGRMDLAQAEAVADLIHARTEASRRTALRQLEGGLSDAVRGARVTLLDVTAEIEARLDFPEEDIEDENFERLNEGFAGAARAIEKLLEQGERGRYLREGVRVAIIGRPNVGKSSLFNALIGMERALVTPHPGTTRDTIEATVDLKGLAVTYVDTAGVRESAGEIETLGIERTRREIERADAVIFVADAGEPPQTEDRHVAAQLPTDAPVLAVRNKIDLPEKMSEAEMLALLAEARSGSDVKPPALSVSVSRREGLADIERALLEAVGTSPAVLSGGVVLTNARHIVALEDARKFLQAAHVAFQSGEPGELVIVDLREAIDRLGAIIGETIGEEILDRIFSTFCIGK